jgi:hypothetical protein
MSTSDSRGEFERRGVRVSVGFRETPTFGAVVIGLLTLWIWDERSFAICSLPAFQAEDRSD